LSQKLNHHFVPQYHFRLFTGGKRYIHLASRDGSRFVRFASVKGQCARHKFYGDARVEAWLGNLGQAQEFPSACREGDYERRLAAAYPIHPELFDRLYTDWSSLDKFQRTRGILRLMAAVIHTLWERQEAGLLILPAMVPIDEPAVQFELTRYLDDPWVPVLEKDVDGAHSLPLHLDRENPNLGHYSACRRVARTLFLGSAPTLHTGNRGLEDRRVKLGCAQPGEAVATFGDALRRLTDQAMHLYVDGRRYWYATQPSVTRLAQDRAVQQDPDAVRAAKKLKNDGLLITQYAGTLLRLELDRVPLWRGDHVSLKQLGEDFALYLYLPRLQGAEVLLGAVRDGVGLLTWQQETFAYAEGWDTEQQRYRGLRAGQIGSVTLEGESVLVKPEVAARQLAEDQAKAQRTTTGVAGQPYPPTGGQTGMGRAANGGTTTAQPVSIRPKRFFGSVTLDPTRVGRDAGRIAEEVIQHLAGLMGSRVEITLEIQVEIPDGTPDHIVRTVTENCRTLRFKAHGFEDA
jgi:hypothetical protein